MEYIKLFLVNGILGYFLQSMGDVIAISAFNKKKIRFKEFLLCTILFTLVAFIVRQLDINFGFHTILIMIVFIVLSITVFKTSVYPTVLAVLFTSIMIILCETINYGVLNLIFGSETVNELLKGGTTLSGKINKALVGTPTNILLISIMVLIYKFQMKRIKKESKNGKTGI